MVEELDPQKFHVLSPSQKKNFMLMGILVLLLLVPSLGYLYYSFAIHRPAQNDNETTLEIEKGQGVTEIAKLLKDQNLINSEFLFSLYVISNKVDKGIQAGVYNIPPGVSLVDLVELLRHGTNDVRLTLLEGWRAEEIAREAAQKFKSVDYENFVKLAKNNEGFLFPDTYFLNVDISEEELMDILTENFRLKTKDTLTLSQITKTDLSEKDIITLASIVEREVANKDDRPIVAGILLKRLKNGELLGADATTQYATALIRFCAPGVSLSCFDGSKDCALPSDITNCVAKSGSTSTERILSVNWWPHDLTQEDLDFNSPYNTRKVAGLSPAPISNPGINAIKAILEAKPTDYNFYLTDSQGVTHYAKALAEHNQNVATYLK